PGIVAADGTLDRAAVAARVFGDPDELAALNAIVHPAVGAEMARRRAAWADTDAIVVLDIPLLVRSDDEPLRDEYRDLAGIVVVDVDPEIAVERLVRFRGFDPDGARARIARQASRAARLAVADFVIDNGGDLEQLEREVERCWAWMRRRRDELAAARDAPDTGEAAAGE
ncbi:MAG: dephospho-CoA kinase, partial [Actinomyces sp.]